MKRGFYVIVERDEDGYYVDEVPQLSGCYAQGKTIDELMEKTMAGRVVTVPSHQSQDIGRGLLRKILRDAELSPDDLRELLNE